MEDPKPIYIPGDTISSTSTHHPGPGTHIGNGRHIHASITGSLVENKPGNTKLKQLPTVSISRPGTGKPQTSNDKDASFTSSTTNILPEVDAVVLARVTRINPRQANVAILVIGENVCADEFPGIIRYDIPLFSFFLLLPYHHYTTYSFSYISSVDAYNDIISFLCSCSC